MRRVWEDRVAKAHLMVLKYARMNALEPMRYFDEAAMWLSVERRCREYLALKFSEK